jgi:hypothetical protein
MLVGLQPGCLNTSKPTSIASLAIESARQYRYH